MQIKIYTGLSIEPEDCVVDQLHPKYQIETIRLWVNLKDGFELHTNSDYIMREINIMIMEGIIKLEDIEVFEDGKLLVGETTGFTVESIDEVIDEQNLRNEELFYKITYGDEE